MIPREQVVRDIVAGIGRRADMIVVPKSNAIAAKAPVSSGASLNAPLFAAATSNALPGIVTRSRQ
ncbi:hypothetical protein J2785_000291 [Burkholderia ambifaria]|nr:hypothetical protein [Burkholderia ambifaria]MDR6497149.1 hypothetical protein [Burkholderia ambifaria]